MFECNHYRYELTNPNRAQEIINGLIKVDREANDAFEKIIEVRKDQENKNPECMEDRNYLNSIRETDSKIKRSKENNAIWYHQFKHLLTEDINPHVSLLNNRGFSLYQHPYITHNEALFILLGLNPHTLSKDNKEGRIFNKYTFDSNDVLPYLECDSDFYLYNTIEHKKLESRFTTNKIPIQDFLSWASKELTSPLLNNLGVGDLSDRMVKILHQELKASGLINSENSINDLWQWIDSDRLLVYLIRQLEKHNYFSTTQVWKLAAYYIKQKNTTPLRKVANHVNNINSRPKGYQKVDTLINIITA